MYGHRDGAGSAKRVVQICDDRGDAVGGVGGEVSVGVEVLGDDLWGWIEADPACLDEGVRREPEPGDQAPIGREIG